MIGKPIVNINKELFNCGYKDESNKILYHFFINNIDISILDENEINFEYSLSSYFWSDVSRKGTNIDLLMKYLDKLNWDELSKNPNAITIIENNLDKVNWYNLNYNKNAIKLLENHPRKISWEILSGNPNAIHLLEKNLDKVNWFWLSLNPNAIHILEKNLDKINWEALSQNPNAIHILEKNLKNINWYRLSQNPNGAPILKNNKKKIELYYLFEYSNDISLINEYLYVLKREKLPGILAFLSDDTNYWHSLLKNPNLIQILDKIGKFYPDSIGLTCLCKNPNPNILFLLTKFNYEKMKENNKHFAEELVAYVFNPNRLTRFSEKYRFEIWDIDDIY